MQRQRKKPGQAIVEFALFATLLMTILAVIIDVGLAFFAYQGVSGAALEGANAASLNPGSVGAFAAADLDIEQRIHFEGGAITSLEHRAAFVDLMDLDNNGSADSTTSDNPNIEITGITNSGNLYAVDCPTQRRKAVCDMRVTVTYLFKPKFFMATVLGKPNIPIRATRQMTIVQGN